MFPTELILIKEVPIHPEVMAAIEKLVCSVHEWSFAWVYKCSERGIVGDSR